MSLCIMEPAGLRNRDTALAAVESVHLKALETWLIQGDAVKTEKLISAAFHHMCQPTKKADDPLQ